MLKDIPRRKVTDVAMAVAPRLDDPHTDDLWDVYLINMKEVPLYHVLVASEGYGQIGNDKVKTTILRHYFEEVGPLRAVQIEPIMPDMFQITNQFWVSFWHDGYMYDKKYVFVRGSIREDHFTALPFLNQQGVMIR